MSALHAEPFYQWGRTLCQSLPEAYQDFFDVFSQEEAKNMPPHREFDHEIHLRMTDTSS